MKIAITGHSSGIGADIYGKLVDDPGFEVRGYSKSNGWNIAEEDGDRIINELLDFDADVVFNNAYYPDIQNKILTTLLTKWKDASGKVIINTGSISGWLNEDLGVDINDTYVSDKRQLGQICINNSFDVFTPKANVRCHNISFSFVDTPLLTKRVGVATNEDHMISTSDAADMLIDLIPEQKYHIPEMIVQCKVIDGNDMLGMYKTANRNMVKHVAKSRREVKKKLDKDPLN